MSTHYGKEGKKVAFQTLGCKLNFSETSTIARMFMERGYERVAFGCDAADVVVINTCTVTDAADKKCRLAIKKAIKLSPNAVVAVIGCYAQVKPESIRKIAGVDIVLEAKEKFKLLDYLENNQKRQGEIPCNVKEIEEFNPAWSFGDRTRTFLKVQDGCDYHCAYCTVPLARGKSRNNSVKETVALAKEISLKGVKEIVLTGVNIGDFGRTSGEDFYSLIRELDKVDQIERFRISSIEPNLLTEEIVSFVASSEKFMPHFHIPLQSGSDKILQLMGRRYQRETFGALVSSINHKIKHCFLGVDVIVGMPGERDEDFADTLHFLEQLKVSQLHVFSYSERQNTRSVGYSEKISSEEKKKRSKILHQLSAMKLHQFYMNQLGSDAKVLFEDFNDDGRMYGFTENYIKTEFPYNEKFVNSIKRVVLQEISESGNMKVMM